MSHYTPKWEKHWPQFERIMKERLQTGFTEYGDGSFLRSTEELVGELEEETLDIIGWGFILWARLQAVKEKAQRVDDATDNQGGDRMPSSVVCCDE